MITWVTPNIAIGDVRDACNRTLLIEHEVDCVLSLRTTPALGEPILHKQLGIRYTNIPVGSYFEEDPNSIKDELRAASYMLGLLLKKYKRILVHCSEGIDRSPFVVAYWLSGIDPQRFPSITKKGFRLALSEMYGIIRGIRPQIIEHPEWL